MAGRRVYSDNDPFFPVFTNDDATGEEGNDMVFREGRWWTRFNWEAKRKNLYKERNRFQRNQAIRAFFSAQTVDPGL